MINNNAVQGGTGNNTGDPLSVGTGWLYSQFASGTLGYNYGAANRTTSANALQTAIWWLEGEVGGDANSTYSLAAVAHFGSAAAAMADGGWNYGVHALNLTENGERRQDVLYYTVPDGGTTLMLLGLGLSGLAFASNRIRR